MGIARLTVRVDKDGLTAFVSVAQGSAIDRAAFEAELSACGVLAGINEENFERISRGLVDITFSCKETIIAQGHKPRRGCDGWLELAFAEGIQAGHLRQDGTLDYHERDLLKPVEPGDTLGQFHAPLAGLPGLRVDGSRIEPDAVRSAQVELRSGVAVDAEGQVRAVRRGVVMYVHEKVLDVVEHHVHKGSVDLHTGNLRMNGSLLVQGDVKHPFSVMASGNVEVRGTIDGATVQAGGALRVKGGVRGADGATVTAQGSASVVHAESAQVSSGGHLSVQEAVNCELRAATIQISGRVRGGHATAEDRIIAKEAGAQSGIATVLTAGEPLVMPIEETRQRINSFKAERMAERAGGRPSDRCKGGKLGRVQMNLEAEQVQRLAERARKREVLLKTAGVQVGLAHPGVGIYMGPAHVILNETVHSSRYFFDEETSSIRAERVT